MQTQSQSLRQSLGGYQIKAMSWYTFLALSIPCGLITASDVGFSNLALVRISLTFYTMVKSSAPIFVIISAYIFGVSRITPALIMVVMTISAGEIMTVLGEAQFELVGFILSLSSAFLAGLRWTVVQFKLSSIDPPLKSSIATMRLLSPVMFMSMLMFAMALERPWIKVWGDNNDDDEIVFDAKYMLWSAGMAVFGATLAISMMMCEYYLIMHSSAIVLMIGGVLKEMITIMVGVIFFGNDINAVNLLVCFIVFSGVILFKLSIHIEKLEKICDSIENNEQVHSRHSDSDISYGSQSDESYTESDSDEQNLFVIGDTEGEEDNSQGSTILEIT